MPGRNVAFVAFLGVAAVVAGVVLAMVLLRSPLQMVQCDGSLPRWMIDAQDYNGGGCAEVLPTSEAPANADWSPYCLGYCDLTAPSPDQGGG